MNQKELVQFYLMQRNLQFRWASHRASLHRLVVGKQVDEALLAKRNG